jgi:thiamine biosynthesis lipoprotein
VQAETRAAGIAAIESAFERVRRLEDVLSTWRESTEMARLNGAPVGVPFRASGELFSLLLETRAVWEETGGAFDPAIGSLIDAWDLRGVGRRPSPAELAAAIAGSGLQRFELDAFRGTVRRTHERAWLDTGGFGKGAALREARQALEGAGIRDAMLDFGGQVVAIGSQEDASSADGRGWRVAVAHPSRREEPAAELVLADASAATSGASERFVTVNGQRWGHVVDPRTGRPVPAWGSVTVVDADPLRVDALSTGLFVLGPEEGRAWLSAHPDVAALVLEESEDGLLAYWTAPLDGMLLAVAAKDRHTDSARAALVDAVETH